MKSAQVNRFPRPPLLLLRSLPCTCLLSCVLVLLSFRLPVILVAFPWHKFPRCCFFFHHCLRFCHLLSPPPAFSSCPASPSVSSPLSPFPRSSSPLLLFYSNRSLCAVLFLGQGHSYFRNLAKVDKTLVAKTSAKTQIDYRCFVARGLALHGRES